MEEVMALKQTFDKKCFEAGENGISVVGES